VGKWRHPSERLTTASLDGARGLAGLTPSGSTHRDEFARVESPGQVGPMAKEFSVLSERDGEGYMSRPWPASRLPPAISESPEQSVASRRGRWVGPQA